MQPFTFLFEHLPWTESLIAWVLAIVLVLCTWALVAFPAYLVIPFIRQARQDLNHFVAETLPQRLMSWMAASPSILQTYASSHSFQHIFDRNHTLWQDAISELKHPLHRLSKLLRDTTNHTKIVADRLARSTQLLGNIRLDLPHIPPIPSVQDLWVDLKLVRRAWAALIITGTLLCALMAVNTGMLSQILHQMEFGEFDVAGIRFYYFLALLLTLLEVAVGLFGLFYTYLLDDDAGHPIWSFVPHAVTVIGTVGLAVMEGFFYSRVPTEDETLILPFLNTSITIQQSFFMWGFFLPIALAFLGHSFVRSIMLIRDGYALTHLKAVISSTDNLLSSLKKTFQDFQLHLAYLQDNANHTTELLPDLHPEKEQRIFTQLSEIVAKIRLAETAKPQWASTHVQPLTDAEIRQQALRHAALLVLTAIVSLLSIWIQAQAIAALVPFGAPWTIGVAQVACLLIAGSTLRPSGTIVEGNTEIRPVLGFGGWKRLILPFLLIAVVLGANLLFLFHFALPHSQGIIWAIIIALGVGIIILGAELTGLFAIALSILPWLISVAKRILAMALLLCLRSTVWVLHCFEFILGIIALPLQKLFQRRAISTVTS